MLQILLLVGMIAAGQNAGEPAARPHAKTIQVDAKVSLLKQVSVPAREAGVLLSLNVKEGDAVQAGQLLGQIDDTVAQLAARVAHSEHEIAKIQSENDVDLRYAKKSLEVARSELQRSTEALEIFANSVSQTEIERLRLVRDQSDLSIEQADRDLQVAAHNRALSGDRYEAAKTDVEIRRVVAPIDGIVVAVTPRQGEWVAPGDPVVRLINLDRVRVEAFVDGTRHRGELKGCPVVFESAAPGRKLQTYKGTIVFVHPELRPVSRQMLVWAEVDNPDGVLWPEEVGRLTITLPHGGEP